MWLGEGESGSVARRGRVRRVARRGRIWECGLHAGHVSDEIRRVLH